MDRGELPRGGAEEGARAARRRGPGEEAGREEAEDESEGRSPRVNVDLPIHLGARPDPRLVASLRAMRGVLPAASAAADESLPAWLSAVHEGGAAALSKRSDLPSEP